ncbi:hypothetical protein AGMMS50239_37160 [Bacteroidia bacterium]|nr:hypothetical protein AGMMS50239_37160 [Bacteroidia bacterium]
MGFIKLTYNIQNPKVSVDSFIQEIEYGSTFALYKNREDIIVHKGKDFKWIDYSIQKDNIEISVQDSFFHTDFFFEKFMTIFVYNLLDFGYIYLWEIDISNSSFKSQICTNKIFTKCGKKYFKGTIFKPYYHLSNEQKVGQSRNVYFSWYKYIKE